MELRLKKHAAAKHVLLASDRPAGQNTERNIMITEYVLNNRMEPVLVRKIVAAEHELICSSFATEHEKMHMI